MRACRRLIDTSFCEMPCELQMFEATHASRVRETAQSLDVLPKLDLVWSFQQWPHEKLMLLCSWHCTVLYFLVQNKLSLFFKRHPGVNDGFSNCFIGHSDLLCAPNRTILSDDWLVLVGFKNKKY